MPQKIKIAINGFGRIGRNAFKIALTKKNLAVVAINDLTDTKTLAQLLGHDTVYGAYEKKVGFTKDALIVAGKKYKVLAEKEPDKLPWKKLEVDVVLECTGRFTDKKSSGLHLKAGAKRVVISAPAKDESIKTLILGVNKNEFNPKKDLIVSNGSCTTNCLAPVFKVLKDEFGVEKAVMSTIHSYTATQNLVDGPHKNLREARAAAQNIIPTDTGATKAIVA
ncbi:MAG: type I glyceraldehyde-3-phosphate dehydrogenase, partial [bacterium]